MIHKYSMSGYNIVLDVESGGVYVVDGLTFNMLDKISLPMDKNCPDKFFKEFSEYTKEEIQDSYNEIYSLYTSKRLFSDNNGYEKYKESSVELPCCDDAVWLPWHDGRRGQQQRLYCVYGKRRRHGTGDLRRPED